MHALYDSVKEYLYKNPSDIVSLLEQYGLHSIKQSRRYIQGALPDGDNPTSFCLNISNEKLYTKIFTRNKFKGYDLIDAISFISSQPMGVVLKEIQSKFNIQCDYIKATPTSVTNLKSFLGKYTNYDKLKGNYGYNRSIDVKILDMFFQQPNKMFLDDGISIETQIKYEVGYDIIDRRITIPIRDEGGRLISVKGRTFENAPMKYIAYEPYNASDVLYGYWFNKGNIKREGVIIVFEAEKSVMKADSMGIDTAVALSKKSMSKHQRDTILQSGVKKCYLAFDKDVSDEDVAEIADDLSRFIEVWIIKDNLDLLGEKDSPVDCGDMVWDELYEQAKQYKGVDNIGY